MTRLAFRILLSLIAVAALLILLGIREARKPVVVAQYTVSAPGMRCSHRPLRVVVVGDLHISSIVTPPAQIAEVVRRANALRPDLVVLVGDYFSNWWPADEASRLEGLAPLAGLKPRIGTVAILGNNDWRDGEGQISAILKRVGVTVLNNDVFVTPEVAVKGIAEITSNTANPPLVEERYASQLALQRIAAPPLTLWLAHDPIMFGRVKTTGDMLFTGHTHGGQFLPEITLPVIRTVVAMGRSLGWRAGWPAEHYVRGAYVSGDKRMIVTSGVGTSVLPLRLGVPPEIMLARFTGCVGADSAR